MGISQEEYRLCQLVWTSEPVAKAKLLRRCRRELGWKPSAARRRLRHLAEQGVLKQERAIVTALAGPIETLLSCCGEEQAPVRKKKRSGRTLLWLAAALAVCACGVFLLKTQTSPQEPAALTLDDVITLSEKGHDLTWADFASYSCIETGHGLYIRLYDIDEMFYLSVGGNYDTSFEPMYVRLSARNEAHSSLDIRDGGVEAFIRQHENSPVVTPCSWSFTCTPVGYSGEAFQSMLTMGGIPKTAILSSVQSLPVVRLESTAHLEQFIRAVEPYLDLDRADGSMELSFRQAASRWDDSFFEENTLFVVYVTSDMSGCDCTLSQVQTWDDILSIEINVYEPSAGDAVMDGHLLCVSIPSGEVSQVKTTDARICEVVSQGGGTAGAELSAVYVMTGTEEIIMPSVALYDNGWFHVTFSAYSSYLGVGEYELTSDTLTLRTLDGENVYVFDVAGDSITYNEEASDAAIWSSPIVDGSVFTKEADTE